MRDASAKFWDKTAARYAKRPISDQAAYEKKLEVTRSYLNAEMEVLEFGCGTGSTALAHAPYVKHIHAIDFSANMIEIAQQKAHAQNIHNVSFARASIDEFHAQDNAFDAVLGLNVLHLLDDMQPVLNKVHRILKPGGLFVSSTVCLGDRMRFMKVLVPLGKLIGLMPQLRIFGVSELEGRLKDAAFDIDYRWQPTKSIAVFIVARKAASA